jgi:lysophospholipase L1-like esterase
MPIFFFGDSICFGQFVAPHQIWVTRVAEHLASVLGRELSIINTSLNGNTTRMALERMPFDVQSHGVDHILIQFGMNDCNYWVTDRGLPRVSPAAFRANLAEIILRARTVGARTVFLATNHPSARTQRFDHIDRTYEDGNLEYNAIIREVARDSAILIDHEAVWRRELAAGVPLSSLLLADGLHLSVSGHDLYYRTVAPVMAGALLAESP